MSDQVDKISIGPAGCYAAKIDDMNFQIFNADGQALGLVWEVTGEPGQFRCVPTSNISRPISGGIHSSLTDAGLHCITTAIL